MNKLKSKLLSLKKNIKRIALNFLSLLKKHKNITLIIVISILLVGIGIYASYSFFNYTTTRSLIEGQVGEFESPQINIKYMVESRDAEGVGNNTYTAFWNAPEKEYIYIPEKSFCTNGATFTRNEDDTFDIFSNGKTRCEFYYDAVDLTYDSDLKIKVFKEKGSTCSSGTCEYDDASDYKIESLIKEGYAFVPDKSTCEGESTITYNEDTKKLETSTKEVTACRVYFEKTMTRQLLEMHDESEGLIQHTSLIETSAGDNNYRYAGGNDIVKNYVCFGSDDAVCPKEDLYRILGIYNIEGEQLVKLIKAYPIDKNKDGVLTDPDDMFIFDSANDNRWEGADTSVSSDDADINMYLNTTYLNEINLNYQEMIEPVKYNIGGVNSNYLKPKAYYDAEQLANTTQKYKIGLMYISDYFYATDKNYWDLINIDWNEPHDDSFYRNEEVKNNNWVYMIDLENYSHAQWTIIPHYTNSEYMYYVDYHGVTYGNYVNMDFLVNPVIHLKSSVKISGGLGTEANPFRISL